MAKREVGGIPAVLQQKGVSGTLECLLMETTVTFCLSGI